MNPKEYHRRAYELAKPAYAALMKVYPFTLEDLDGEIWRTIDEHYHISNYGRTKSFCNGKAKILKPQLRMGYLCVTLCKDSTKKPFLVHRLVALTFIANPDNKPEVNHIDGCKFNNFVGNLEWATDSENSRHAVKNGLYKSGEDNHKAKLTNEQVQYIRQNPDKLTQKKLAKMFGISLSKISYVQLGKTYKNAGGSIRKKQKFGEYHRIPDEIRAQIRADWATGNYSMRALARKYGFSRTTIRRVLSEK